jgi:hypothetical protein
MRSRDEIIHPNILSYSFGEYVLELQPCPRYVAVKSYLVYTNILSASCTNMQAAMSCMAFDVWARLLRKR